MVSGFLLCAYISQLLYVDKARCEVGVNILAVGTKCIAKVISQSLQLQTQVTVASLG